MRLEGVGSPSRRTRGPGRHPRGYYGERHRSRSTPLRQQKRFIIPFEVRVSMLHGPASAQAPPRIRGERPQEAAEPELRTRAPASAAHARVGERMPRRERGREARKGEVCLKGAGGRQCGAGGHQDPEVADEVEGDVRQPRQRGPAAHDQYRHLDPLHSQPRDWRHRAAGCPSAAAFNAAP